jgi:Tfp pilus assembly protein PilF
MSIEIKTRIVNLVRSGGRGEEVCRTLICPDPVPLECELWDYKQEYSESAVSLGELCRDVVAFHNSYGGYLIVGVSDDYRVVGCGGSINQQTLRQKVRDYFGADVAVLVEETVIQGARLLVVSVPKRSTTCATIVARKMGPQPAGGKPIFSTGAVFFRVSDSSQLIRESADLMFLASDRNHSLDRMLDAGSGIRQNNLPDRSVICAKFIGRSEIKKELWLWLADRYSRYRVIAGPGGFGKTSAAYSFAEDICESSSNGFMQAVWLSAKDKQFQAATDTYEKLPYSGGLTDSFRDIESLISAIAESLPVDLEAWDDSSEQDRIESIREALVLIPSFFIIDDLDSLSPDDQRRTIELVIQLSDGKSKFLLTTRNNYLAPAASTTKLPGLTGEDFRDFVKVLEGRFSRSLQGKEIDQLEVATEGSPLFGESVFRLMRLGSRFEEALRLWKGKDGEAVRAASFKRELAQLSLKAKRVIFAMSRLDSVSLPELCKFAELERIEVEQAIGELDQLFLCASEQIAGEPRFRVSDNLRRVLDEVKRDVIPNHSEIERRVAALRKEAVGGGKARGKNAPIAAAINQAMAQLGAGNSHAACETVVAAIDKHPASADLWMVKARCVSQVAPLDIETVRSSFAKSFQLGKREPKLFEKWLEFEREHGNPNAAIDVAEKGSSHIQNAGYEWSVHVASAYFRRAEHRLSRGEAEDSTSDFRLSIKHLREALKRAPVGTHDSIGSAIERSFEGLWMALPLAASVGNQITVLRLSAEAVSTGVRSALWFGRAVVALQKISKSAAPIAGRDIDVINELADRIASVANNDFVRRLRATQDELRQR